jgi:hypothetical protein
LENEKIFIEKSKSIHNNKYDYSKVIYINSHTIIDIICPLHGIFQQKPYVHSRGGGCKKCASINRIEKSTKILEDFIEESNLIFNNKYIYDKSVYITNKTDIIVTCPIHGDFITTPNKHLSHKLGCPYCTVRSKGESIISKFLCENGIDYIQEHSFDDCFYKNKLRFDFYLKKFNICIEYDGPQHFKNVKFYKDSLDEIKIRDSIKNDYCENNNIELIRISYKDNIDFILNKRLSQYKDVDNIKEFFELNKRFFNYEKSKSFLKENFPEVKSQSNYTKWVNSDLYDHRLPKNPYVVYKRSGEWISCSDFFNSNNHRHDITKYLSYEDSKKWISENLGLLSISMYKNMYRNNKNFPNFIPKSPDTTYKNNGWISWLDFLGRDYIRTQDKNKLYLSYEDSKEWLRINKPDIKSIKQYNKHYKDFPILFPSFPKRTYKDEWISWIDFLSKNVDNK